jgi:DNA-binding NarL/FixJ family response regulator
MHAWLPESAVTNAPPAIDRSTADVVLIVDDVPDNLAVLHDALDESGYTVLVATSGESALQRAAQAVPDIVLLDAVMPGLDGFEVARRLKALPKTAHIPIVFMTGLTETEHVVRAFAAGGVDYVTKPLRPREVLARMAVHMQGAREKRQARNALDAFGHATIVVRAADGRVLWQTPLARELLQGYGVGSETEVCGEALAWVRAQAQRAAAGEAPQRWASTRETRRLVMALHEETGDGQWLIVLQERSDKSAIEGLAAAFKLTAREAEVLYWVVKGKTNRDIGDILDLSPRTVHKHLEHVFAKLGVETRTAAAAMALAKVRGLDR